MNKLTKLGIGIILSTSSLYYCLNNKKHKVFVWGNGFYQAIPGQGISFANFSPKHLIDFDDKDFIDLSFNGKFEGGITSKGECYVWDSHNIQSNADPEVDDSKRKNIVKLNNPGKGSIIQLKYTKQFLWTLTSNGEVYQYPIEQEKVQNSKVRKVQSLSNIQQIEVQYNVYQCGEDHFVALNKEGEIYTMGDDTTGQCGLGSNRRSSAPPFYEHRQRVPEKLQNLPKIKKIVCGLNHTLALSEEGGIYGWGSNSQMQLSHLEEFSKLAEPLIAVYNPIRLSSLMDSNNEVIHMAAGSEFSVFVTRNKQNKETEVFSCGHNIRGQLGAGFVRHVSDIVKVEGLSNFKIDNNGKQENVEIVQLQCGNNHCMALTNVGAILEWGDNEYGQLGNKKRSFSDKPIVVSQFVREKVFKIHCGGNQSGVITQEQV